MKVIVALFISGYRLISPTLTNFGNIFYLHKLSFSNVRPIGSNFFVGLQLNTLISRFNFLFFLLCFLQHQVQGIYQKGLQMVVPKCVFRTLGCYISLLSLVCNHFFALVLFSRIFCTIVSSRYLFINFDNNQGIKLLHFFRAEHYFTFSHVNFNQISMW